MPKTHRVRAGECISSIAVDYGFFPATIWNHDNNEQLRELRDPNVLHVGDEVFIPDREIMTKTGATDQRHTFTRKGVPAKFRIQICNGTEPRPNVDFSLLIDGDKEITGKTDDEGVVSVFLPPKAREGRLTIGEGEQVIDLFFGHLDPIEEDSGVKQRLYNLGLLDQEDASDADMLAAVALFQAQFGLEETGELDSGTRVKIGEVHDGREMS